MSIPKGAGIETEYAIIGADPCTSSRRVVSGYPHISLSADGNPCVRRGGDDDLMLPNGARFTLTMRIPSTRPPKARIQLPL